MQTLNTKPLGRKIFGKIEHLSNSKLGTKDISAPLWKNKICTVKKRDQYDKIIVQEKLDGSCCGVTKLNNQIIPLTKRGYIAISSPFRFLHAFHYWVMYNTKRFESLLNEGETIIGEWMLKTHSTHYVLPHEPFVAFNITKSVKTKNDTIIFKIPHYDFYILADKYNFITPSTVHIGDAIDTSTAMEKLIAKNALHNIHGTQGTPEGLIYTVERLVKSKEENSYNKHITIVDFVAKYVNPEHKTPFLVSEDHPKTTFNSPFQGFSNYENYDKNQY